MADHRTADLRNFAIVGHGAVGKSTLAEAILLETGVTNRMGKPREGTSAVDFDDEEKERRFSIYAKAFFVKHKGKQLQFIDTPGYDDFFGEVVSACAAVETALLVVPADAGIQVNTRRVWKRAVQQGLGRAIVVSKLDSEGAKFEAVVEAIRATFGKGCVPVNLPVGSGPAFSGVVSALNPPADAADEVKAAAEALREAIVESDDSLMERYLEGEEIAPAELLAAASHAVAKGTLVPIFCCAAERRLGVPELLDGIVALLPSPVDGLQRACVMAGTGEAVERPATEEAPFAAQVFKALYDPYVGKLAFLRIFSGRLKPEDGLYNSRAGERSKLGHIYRPQGKEQVEVDSAVPGDIVVVAKIESLEVSDTLCDERDPVTYPAIVFPVPMVSRAAEPKTRADEQRMSTALSRIASQDKTFLAGRDEQTGELVITGMSDLHLDVVMSKLGRKPFEVEMNLKEPRIPYKETIGGKNSASYRHKKQTGGRGQFAEVHLRVEPLERGQDFEFVDEIYGGAIPRQFVPAVEKGVRETMAKGVIAGCPVVDVRVAVYDGKYHDVDSSEAAFKIASSRAFRDAFKGARPQLLEPIVNMEITVPSKYFGDISGDLSGRRGRIQGMGVEGDQQIISAQVPLAEVSNYSTQLRSITGGEGSYTMEFSHYEPVPPRVQEVIVAKAAKAKAGEEEE
mgnify:FL=1